ncbi:hypothetical protein [Demequina sp. NBRC 110056]|uniref:hypothetical protein n=1 Tax=Demequina sp. NBRC 110056 TaxID=1570345 RepID=UPI0009FDD175|nr:hypothetical protein [Demequina sp. NBRC 110056]
MARGFSYADGASEEVEMARRADLSRAQVQALAGGKNAVVRELMAQRGDLPLGTMVSLAHDRSVEVRAAMAGNRAATASILEHLSGDRHQPVLHALLDNPTVERAIIERLAFHKRDEIRAHAVRRLDDAEAASARTDDRGVPELRERGTYADVVELPVQPVRLHDDLPVRPTRTAPVRGFRPAEEA